VGLFAVVVGGVCVAIGWHWKLMHRAWQDVHQVRDQAKGKLPALKALRSHHTSKALVFGVLAVVLIALALH
jgi:hypothetical protein